MHTGTLVVTAAGESFTLAPSDALTFPGDVAHSYANPGETTTNFSLTVYEPGVGSGRPVEAAQA